MLFLACPEEVEWICRKLMAWLREIGLKFVGLIVKSDTETALKSLMEIKDEQQRGTSNQMASIQRCLSTPTAQKRVERRWPICSFPLPKQIASERPIALLPTLFGGGGWLRALVIDEWKTRSGVKWCAGGNGGAEKKACEALLYMEKHNYNVEEMDQGAVTLVVDLAKAFAKMQLKVVWAWAMHIGFPHRITRVLCGYFQHGSGGLQGLFFDRHMLSIFKVTTLQRRTIFFKKKQQHRVRQSARQIFGSIATEGATPKMKWNDLPLQERAVSSCSHTFTEMHKCPSQTQRTVEVNQAEAPT